MDKKHIVLFVVILVGIGLGLYLWSRESKPVNIDPANPSSKEYIAITSYIPNQFVAFGLYDQMAQTTTGINMGATDEAVYHDLTTLLETERLTIFQFQTGKSLWESLDKNVPL